jgi:predicted MPP superfamily phosphohydrolase
MKILRPFLVITVLLGLLHAYIGFRLIPELPGGHGFAGAFLVFSYLVIPSGMLARFLFKPILADILTWVGSLMMGFFSSLLVLTILRDLTLGLSYFLIAAAARSELAVVSALAVPGLAALATVVGLFFARRNPPVIRVDVPVANLSAALDGFQIAQISDVHVGPTIKRPYVEAIVTAVNALHPDMVAITGDLVDGSVMDLGRHVAPIAELSARHGAYFVSGNHDNYSGVDDWGDELERLGVHVLSNRHVILDHDGAQLVIAGVTDYSARSPRSDPHAALAGAPGTAVKILLAHQPRSALEAAKAGFDLQLSGHTHGGQFWPWNHFVRLQQPFTAGLHRLDRLWVYVNRGTGYWGPPKRLGVTSEITLLRLVPAG